MIHVCQSVEGALRNWKKADWRSVARANGWSIEQTKEVFWQYMREGKRVIPIGEMCEGFSYESGCPGHQSAPKK